MLHTIALLPLLAAPYTASSVPAPSAPAADRLLAALPSDTFLAVHASDPRSLIAARNTNDWVAFALDSEWERICHTMMQGLGDDISADEVIEWRNRVVQGLGESTGAVAFIAGDFTTNEPTAGLIVAGGEQSSRVMLRFLGDDMQEVQIGGGRTALVSESGRGELFYEHEGLIMVLSAPTVAGAQTVAAECLDAYDSGAPATGPFASAGLRAERTRAWEASPPAFEVAVDLGRVWQSLEAIEGPIEGFERTLFDALTSMEWVYATARFGDGEAADWDVALPYGEDTLLGGLLGHFGTADKSMFEVIPKGATGGVAMAFDVAGFAQWALEVAEGKSKDDRELIEQGFQAAKETTGIDVWADVVQNFTGQFAYFTSSAGAEGPIVPFMTQGMTFVAEVEDAEPWIDIVDQLLDMSGAAANVLADDVEVEGTDDTIETWKTDAESEVPVAVAVGAGRVAVSIDHSAFDSFLELARGAADETSIHSNASLRRALGSVDGAMVAVNPTVATATAIEDMVRGANSLLGSLDPFQGLANSGQAQTESGLASFSDGALQIAALFRQYFSGTTTSEVVVGGGMVRMRTMAR